MPTTISVVKFICLIHRFFQSHLHYNANYIVIDRFFESHIYHDASGIPRMRSNFSPSMHAKYTKYYRIYMAEFVEFLIPFILLGKVSFHFRSCECNESVQIQHAYHEYYKSE